MSLFELRLNVKYKHIQKTEHLFFDGACFIIFSEI